MDTAAPPPPTSSPPDEAEFGFWAIPVDFPKEALHARTEALLAHDLLHRPERFLVAEGDPATQESTTASSVDVADAPNTPSSVASFEILTPTSPGKSVNDMIPPLNSLRFERNSDDEYYDDEKEYNRAGLSVETAHTSGFTRLGQGSAESADPTRLSFVARFGVLSDEDSSHEHLIKLLVDTGIWTYLEDYLKISSEDGGASNLAYWPTNIADDERPKQSHLYVKDYSSPDVPPPGKGFEYVYKAPTLTGHLNFQRNLGVVELPSGPSAKDMGAPASFTESMIRSGSLVNIPDDQEKYGPGVYLNMNPYEGGDAYLAIPHWGFVSRNQFQDIAVVSQQPVKATEWRVWLTAITIKRHGPTIDHEEVIRIVLNNAVTGTGLDDRPKAPGPPVNVLLDSGASRSFLPCFMLRELLRAVTKGGPQRETLLHGATMKRAPPYMVRNPQQASHFGIDFEFKGLEEGKTVTVSGSLANFFFDTKSSEGRIWPNEEHNGLTPDDPSAVFGMGFFMNMIVGLHPGKVRAPQSSSITSCVRMLPMPPGGGPRLPPKARK
ncbi:uncharacterized protein BXZ73DRAFT_104628 [Epithele typhae]|uniref:uncharacterized protein n=1 Tax=Epithele typhae TaxID=378194 RepID=UPI002008D551|nr:uncharacterized protein BXZ73DRAFT_104628 [Epithele typhae]KAH9920501.1 hypothetical protein BXZ73DRAFT_104628 [Epithele typhae]